MKLLTLAKLVLRENEEDYRGSHQAPDKEGGAPLNDLKDIYPDDIYSSKGAEYYGHGEPSLDYPTISIIQSAKGRPNMAVRVYRAVPSNLTTQEKIIDIEKQKAYIQKHGKLPPNADTTLGVSAYYDKLYDELNRLKLLPTTVEPKLTINKHDWVTLNRAYAKEHGESTLRGKYKILSKVVRAKDLYTDGNSIHEWGYDP